jgi:hypothetical protein
MWDHDPDLIGAAVDVPVLLLAVRGGWPGKEARVERFASNLRDVRVEWFDGHHDLHAQQPRAVVDRLLDLAAEVSL